MWQRFGVVLCILFLEPTIASAEDKNVACRLLVAGEITAAVGGPSPQPHESAMVIKDGPYKGETMYMCMWQVGQEGMVSVSPIRLRRADREAGLKSMRDAVNALKAQGWAEERKTFDDGECSALTPPKGKQDAPFTTGCFGEAKGKGASITWLGKKPVPIERVKALYDAAVRRLP